MKILLDTSIFIWYILDDVNLSKKHSEIIEDLNNEIYLSVISVWEATIKQQIGKIDFPESASKYLPKQREKHEIKSLSLDESTIKNLFNLPLLHKDPFDRILICQAIEYDFFLMTVDETIRKYEKVKLI
jgi:PIN domain nuclease of toxin-antitoxin system